MLLSIALMRPLMIEIFDSGEYQVLIDDSVMIFRPRTINGSALLLPPPSVKPQFYSLLAVLLAKSGVEVVMPRWHLPCNPLGLRRIIDELLRRGNYGLVIMLGFDMDTVSNPKLIVRFNGDNIIRQLARSNVPGAVRGSLISDCAWIRDSIERADLSVDEELSSLNTIIRIRDLALETLHLRSVSKNNN
ncbi:hypothetical protein JCM14467A_02710 [Vulcanisaeta sp. JCM 14467]